MYTFLTELLGNIIRRYEEIDFIFSDLLHHNNWIVYNIYNIIFFIYFCYVYWICIKRKAARNFILAGGVLFVICSIINPYIKSFETEFQMEAYFVGAIVLIISTILYGAYLKSVTGQRFINTNLLSWLSLGILIFYIGYLPIILIGYYRIVEPEQYFIVRRIHLLLIVIMYVCFILGFMRMSRRSIS